MSEEVRTSFVVACSNLIERDGGYMLVRETKAAVWHRYNFPAGRAEAGESLVDAAVREAKEETGLKVVVSYLVGIISVP
jgi:8-oxo-dGTP diphosphatase